MSNANWTFFKAFVEAPRVIGSVIPSSTFLERRVVTRAEAAKARVVVELGAGVGGITKALLQAMDSDARLLAIEATSAFADNLRRIDEEPLDVVHGCASTMAEELRRRGLPAADAVVSGIPFSTLPEPLCREIAAAIHDVLAPGGRFVAYQVTRRVADYMRPLLGAPETEIEFLNIPPLRVFTWRKEGLAESGEAQARKVNGSESHAANAAARRA